MRVTGLPDDVYVKDARFGSADVLNQPVQISGPTADVLEVVLSPAGGRIDGSVVDDRRQPMPNAQVVLVPDNRARIDLFKVSAADQSGRFTFRGVAPGGYKVLSDAALESFAYFDPQVSQRAESSTAAVRVAESTRLDLTVRHRAGGR